MYTNEGKEAIIIDKNGKQRILRNTRHGWQIKREETTPILAMNKLIGVYIGKKLREKRLEKGYTMKFLGELCGWHSNQKQTIYAIEHNLRNQGIRMGTLYLFAMFLECNIMDLLPTKEEIVKDPVLKQISKTLQEIREEYSIKIGEDL